MDGVETHSNERGGMVEGRIQVGVMGASGTVGSRLVAMLVDHPWFELVEVSASERSEGARLAERMDADASSLPPALGELVLRATEGAWSAPLIFSALPSGIARAVEPALAARGHLVVSNASAFRADPGVPLIIPEVNPDHLSLVGEQGHPEGGGLVTNPNCVVAGLAMALAPLHRSFGLEAVVATTFQAISGAGRPGPSALDIVDNMIPWIGGEEEKIAAEPRKILGDPGAPADFAVDATATRVPVLHGHTVSVGVRLREPATPEEARAAFETFGRTARLGELPSSPERILAVTDQPDRPQPRLDRDAGDGHGVTVGRIRRGEVMHLSFVVLAHNLVRGAAGAALLNAELCAARGMVASGTPTAAP